MLRSSRISGGYGAALSNLQEPPRPWLRALPGREFTFPMSLPLFVTIARREKARRIAVAAFFTVSASWLLCMPVTAACGFELPKTVYFLVQKVQYDENARALYRRLLQSL